MKVRIIQELLLLGVVFGLAKGFLDDTDFQILIKERCYNRTQDHRRLVNGQHHPLSNSMETFIDLLERFEKNYTSYTSVTILEQFLTRFRIDGIIEEWEDVFRQSLQDKYRLNVVREMLKPTAKVSDFPEEAFTEDEKCALYYMLSYANVKDRERHFIPTGSPDQMNSVQVIEQGVVTLNNNPKHSIAIGKVLLGILAGLKGSQKRSVRDILAAVTMKPVKTPKEEIQLTGDISPLYGVTIGDTIAAEVLRSVNETRDRRSRKFGPNGIWNSTICPTKYILEKEATDATYGQMRGAGDGFILGLQVRELQKKNMRVPISTLLRMYYSSRGIPGTAIYSFCKRWENWGEFSDKAQEQIHYFSRLMNIYKNGGMLTDKMLVDGAREAISEFEHSREDIVDKMIKGEENCFNLDMDLTPACDTPSDVFVVLDNRGNIPEIWDRQKKAVASLATKLDLRYYGGRLNVFTNSRGIGDRVLEHVVINATSEGCIGCKLDWYYSGYSPVDETYVLESLYKMLTNYEADRLHSVGVPGKTIVYFNYGDTVKEDRNFRKAYWDIKDKHRDVQIFSIGSNRKVLESIATDKEKVILEETAEEIAKNLKDEICESPGILQYSDCNEKTSRMDDPNTIFHGYVIPKRIQYWSMFPEYFLKSYDIKFEFTATGGDIKVCYSRSKHRLSSGYCKEITSAEPIFNVYVSNPCRGKTVYNCAPFHFSIEGKDSGSHEPRCFDKECKTFDQIKFTIKHEGISCNGSTQLLSSFVLLVLSLFYLMKINK